MMQEPQPYWLRRNLNLIRGRNASDEGAYAEIICNYQILAADLKQAQRGGGMAPASQSTNPTRNNFNIRARPEQSTAAFESVGSPDRDQSDALNGSTNRAFIGGGTTPSGRGDVQATIKELSNELDRTNKSVQEKQTKIAALQQANDRLEAQAREQGAKLANASLSINKLENDAKKREDMVNILKNEREGFLSENDSLRKAASDATRNANKYRNDLINWKEVEIGLRQQVFELESLVAAIRRGEADRHIQQQQQPAESLSNAHVVSANNSNSEGAIDFITLDDLSPLKPMQTPAATATQQQQTANAPARNRLTSFIDSFLSYGGGNNAQSGANHNSASPRQGGNNAAGGKEVHRDTEANFTQQVPQYVGIEGSRGSAGTASIPSYASFSVERAHDGELQPLCFTENAKHIWTGGAEKVIKCWDVNTGKQVVRLPCSNGAPLSLHSAGEVLAVGCSDSTVRVFETSRFRDRCQLTGHNEKVTTAILSADAYKVYSTSTDRTIKKWAVSREQMENTIMCVSGCNDISALHDKLVSAHHDGCVRIWDCRDCKEAGEIKSVHDKAIASVRWIGEGMMVASMGRDDTIRISDIRTMKVLHTIRDHSLRVVSNMQRFDVSSDGRYLSVGAINGNLLFYSVDGASLVAGTFNTPKMISSAHAGPIMNVVWHPEGKGVATVGSDKKLVYWR